MVIVEVMTF